MGEHRQLILDAVNHREPARLPVDFGATTCSGLHCSVVAALREHYGLEKRLVMVHEPGQMLGYVEEDLREAMGVSAVSAMPTSTSTGAPVDGRWKEWRANWGQTVLIPEGMALARTDDGGWVAFPQGDSSASPCAKMPESGYFFDAIIRQGDFDEENPDPADNTEEFVMLGDEAIRQAARCAGEARASGAAVVAKLPGTGLGDIAQVPGMGLKNPKGIRDVAEWYMSIACRPEFIHRVFERQTETAIENLKKLAAAAGDDYDVVYVCGTDFGTQSGTFCSRETLLELYSPYYRKINGWVHDHTGWKTLKHCCGAIEGFIDVFIESGFDILNPVQCSASGMDPEHLKKVYGGRIVFLGGGGDTQKTLPFGNAAEARREALERCRIFAPGGGYVFNAIHNVQALTPTANVLALLDAVNEYNSAGK